MKRIGKRLGIVILLLLVMFTGIFAIYVKDYYKAKTYDMSQLQLPKTMTIQKQGNYTWIGTKDSDIGYIFYPGAKVDEKAYIPLLATIAKENKINCVLVKMPFHLAVFDINAADGVIKQYPQIKTWYIGGHSLGGAMAASYAANNTLKVKGLILMGAYPVKLLPKDFPVLAIYGSNDQVLNTTKLKENKKYANNYNLYKINGGNHAWFGYYGLQKGDGTATIAHKKQWDITANQIEKYFKNM